jgi:hypothetical protein
LLIRKGKPCSYPAQGCRFFHRVKPFWRDKVGKNWLKSLYPTDDVYLPKTELKREESETANRGNAEDRSQPLIVGSEDDRYFSDRPRSLFHAYIQALF